jgi:sugar phosphate isomerase/epimerase
MKISIAPGDVFHRFGIADGSRLIAESGFEALDLDLGFLQPWGCLDRTDPNKWENASEEELLQAMLPYKEAASQNGLVIGQTHASYPTYHKTELGRQRISNLLHRQVFLTRYLDCPRMVIHPGYLAYTEQLTQEESWDANISLFADLIPTLKEHRVKVCIENLFLSRRGKMMDGVCSDAEEACRYVDTLNEMAGEKCFAFCLDTGHSLMLGKDMRKFIHTVGHRLEALHLNDNDGTDDLHTMPYTGALDWERTVDALRDVGYSGTVNFELILSHLPKAVLPQALQYIASVGRYIEKKLTE